MSVGGTVERAVASSIASHESSPRWTDRPIRRRPIEPQRTSSERTGWSRRRNHARAPHPSAVGRGTARRRDCPAVVNDWASTSRRRASASSTPTAVILTTRVLDPVGVPATRTTQMSPTSSEQHRGTTSPTPSVLEQDGRRSTSVDREVEDVEPAGLVSTTGVLSRESRRSRCASGTGAKPRWTCWLVRVSVGWERISTIWERVGCWDRVRFANAVLSRALPRQGMSTTSASHRRAMPRGSTPAPR
jgi:hypothetical protein